MNGLLSGFYKGFDVCGSGAAGVYNEISVEWSDLGASYGKAFKAAFVYELAAWGAEGMVVLKNAAGAWVFEVAFIYAFGYVFFAVGGNAVVGCCAGGPEAESCLCEVELSSLRAVVSDAGLERRFFIIPV